MRTGVTIVLIVLVSLAAIVIVCVVNAPRWMDGQPVAATRPA
jgi:hypothetical protein